MEGEEGDSRSVHQVMLIVLPYLSSLYELLCMSRVCRSLRDAVRLQTVLWTNVVVDAPISSRISDEILTDITSRASGKLISLILRRCVRITDDGLRRVVHENPLISRLSVAGCTGLTPEGIIRAVQTLATNNHKLESLHVNGIYGFTKHHFLTLASYVAPPHGSGAIDVDICPKCDQVRMIPACSRPSCKQEEQSEEGKCRACRFCVPRCVECAVCMGSGGEVQETACSDEVCIECWLLLPKCSFCNKPYCTSHTSLGSAMDSHSAFLCQACHFSATQNQFHDFDS